MELKEIEQKIDDAMNEIPLKSIMQESKDKLELKLKRYDENRKKKEKRLQLEAESCKTAQSEKSQRRFFVFGIEAGILIVLSIFAYQLIIKNLFN